MKSGLKKIVSSKRVVIKVGTRLLSDAKMNLETKSLETVAENVMAARRLGKAAVLVTSGAVGAGMGELGFSKRPQVMVDKQACAAVGQSLLMHEYERLFSALGVVTAQVLLTRHDINDRARHQNIRKVMERLLEMNVLPIVNENDVVADEELKFGDNDTLAGLVAELIDAEALVILTDVDGLFESMETKRRIPVVDEITESLYAVAGAAGGETSVGGMTTKLKAAEKMARAGRITVLASGKRRNTVERILSGENVGTLILPSKRRVEARKRWIGDQLLPQGSVVVDAGAAAALLTKGGSLLPGGIKGVRGDFVANTAVEVLDESGIKIGQGLAAYGAEEIRRIMGAKSSQIKARLGFTRGDEVIHRDNLVMSSRTHGK